MRRIILFIFLFFCLNVPAQTLLDTYKKGNVRLSPDSNYGINNDWGRILSSYQNAYSGYRMPIVLMPDGSLVMNHPKQNYYSKLKSDGHYESDFSIVNRSGKAIGRNQDIIGIMGDKFYTESDEQGKILFCDFKGNYLKTLTLDYIVRSIVPVGSDKLCIAGYSIWKDKIRNLISMLDYHTNKEKIIWENFVERDKVTSIINNDPEFARAYYYEQQQVPGYYHSQSISLPPIIHYAKGNLIIIFPSSGEINVYNTAGKLQKTFKADWKPEVISIEEQKEVLRSAINNYKQKPLTDKVPVEHAKKARQKILSKLSTRMNNIKEIQLPFISNVIKDSDDNLLFFEFPKETGGNRFHVWSANLNEQFECSGSFECKEYDLSITPARMVFYDRCIYSIQKSRNESLYRIIKLNIY